MDVRLPDGTIIRNVPDGISKAELTEKLARNGYDVSKLGAAPKQERSLLDDVAQGAGNLVAGAVRGAGSIGATLLAPIDIAKDALSGKGLSLESNRQRRAGIDGGLQELGAETDSLLYQGGKLAGEIAGTAGAGGVLANGVARVAPSATGITNAIRTGGFVTGQPAAATFGGKAANLGVRATGGAITGGATAFMVDPESTATGAAISGALPVALTGAGKVARVAGEAYRSARTPQETKLANKLADLINVPQDELRAALTQQGPQMIPGYRPTVPQIVQTPEISQLQRTLKTAGANAIGDAERLQQQQFMQALNRVAPVDISVQDAAQRAGSAIKNFAVGARDAATKEVRDAFDSVDPFNETALFLPIEEMRRAQGKFLGDGTFGTGGKAREAVATAEKVGTEVIPETKPVSMKGVQDLVLAVRAAGGINTSSRAGRDLAGEIRNLKESGLNNIVRPNSGKSVERIAEEMYQRGFLPDDDPATLLNLLQDSAAGQKVYAAGSDDYYRYASDMANGGPQPAEIIEKTVPFQTVQNLRSSIGEAAEQAAAKGANKEAAALRQMVSEIDSRINRAAGGNVAQGENFPKDMADQYRRALSLHAEKMQRFETGPQVGMFRKGGDGQASIQGAEIPGKFFSGRRSQVEDMQALKRLVGNQDALMAEMKRYAVMEGANTANQAGALTSKFTDWLLSRSGANRELFDAGELATLREVGKAVERQLAAENLGRVSGSDTAQKLASLNSLGLLDNKLVDVLANRIPFVGSFTGPALSGLRDRAAQDRNALLSRLLAEPEWMASVMQQPQPGGNALLDMLNKGAPMLYRSAPVISAQ